MSATEHAPLPRPLPTSAPKDPSPSPRISHQEPLRPIQPRSLDVEPEQKEPPSVRSPVPPTSPLPEPTPLDDKPEPPSQPKPEEPTKEAEDKDNDDNDDDDNASKDVVHMETFEQILELDEDDTHDFSQPMVWEYFEQAEKTFNDMNEAHENKDLPALSRLGHYLKGSSAALGLARVQNSCEKIQHYGQLRDEVANRDLTPAEALEKTSKLLRRVRKEYNEAQDWLKKFYGPQEGA
ncbi:Multistep phosphorelay regulator 1 [Psilocybe cubensis]|uniref:Multistep phosphorelay regulator 1 n=2 Tax=Psilocybe cubensis TaxID=181762 RepID=A0ACB8GYJ5_PSICU|nr:Multistep phosphorelay regulator 1 [Psilocybe cubensis]KAH9480539.1 Multistep phosphorelay regulator 1 [Psilocybe cubensis]